MLTKHEMVSGTVSIWAIPQSRWHMETFPDDPPFTYELRTDTPWADGAVKVVEHHVELLVPEGINLIQKAVETLREEQQSELRKFTEKNEEIENRIRGLLLLAHQDDNVIVQS